jgi:hypothetical protein
VLPDALVLFASPAALLLTADAGFELPVAAGAGVAFAAAPAAAAEAPAGAVEVTPSNGSSVSVNSAVFAIEPFAVPFAGASTAPSWNGVASTSPVSNSALSKASASAASAAARDTNSGAGRSISSAAGAAAAAAEARERTGLNPERSSSGSTSSDEPMPESSRAGTAEVTVSRSGASERGGSEAARRSSGLISSSPAVAAPRVAFGVSAGRAAAPPDAEVLRAGCIGGAPPTGSSTGRSVRGSSIGRDVASIDSSLATACRQMARSTCRPQRADGGSSISKRAAIPAGTSHSQEFPARDVHNSLSCNGPRDTANVMAHRSNYAIAARD